MEHVPRPPPRMVRLSDLQSAWECSRSAGLEMRNPKVTLKSQIGHLEPVLGPVEKIKEFEDLGLLAGRVKIVQILDFSTFPNSGSRCPI